MDRLMRRGYSLIELLVAILVVAVGVLGVAGLQLASARNARTALETTLAAMLAEDMADRIQANTAGTYTTGPGTPPPAFVDCLARDCDAAELAAFDLAVWKCSLGRWHAESSCAAIRATGLLGDPREQPGLPGGDGGVDSAGDGAFSVTVTWQAPEPREFEIRGGHG